MDNEKVLAESQLYNLLKFRTIMIVVGGVLFLLTYGMMYSALGAREILDPEGCVALIVGLSVFAVYALIGIVVYAAFHNNSLIVTDKRVTGKISWGKQVELPRNQISAIALGGIKGVAIATSSGTIKFSLIKNRDEIFKAISDLLKATQDSVPAASAPVIQQSTDADELAKFKALLDSGAITQEEYDAKKKQILGL